MKVISCNTVEGTRDFLGRTTHVRVVMNQQQKKGTMEFWQSYPSFSPRGVKSFNTQTRLNLKTVKEKIENWENGGGLSFD
jgi:hypothetical protein